MFEHRTHPLLPTRLFVWRLMRMVVIAAGVVFGGLGIGVLGYRMTEGLPWIDSLLNASMIFFGMGPANVITTTSGKLFASAYAMFSGMVFVTITVVLFAPLFHRMIHKFHLELAEEDERDRTRMEAEERT